MPKENNNAAELTHRVEEARDAIDAALKILKKAFGAPRKIKAVVQPSRVVRRGTPTLDFTMPLRAFVKKHSDGLNGAKKFALLLAYLTKGDASKTVPLSDIQTQWNKMTGKGLLGMKFNRLYTSQARENDWVSTEKTGSYRLRPSWKAIFSG
jgi:hypothetical protein